MKPPTGATPLIAIAAVAIDTETTGLDATKARVVQIGAIGIARGRSSGNFSSISSSIRVKQSRPRLRSSTASPMPMSAAPRASRMHGRGSRNSSETASSSATRSASTWRCWNGECRRARLPWNKPRALCVRLLASLANPNLADHSLDTIAAWLGLEIVGRHSALGDAIAAGDIFAALIPELRKRNIRTLGEAEVACLGLSHALEAGHRAGWAEPVSRPQAPAFQPVDPYAYRHRVGSLMSHPPVVVKSTEPTRQVIDLMVKRKISSVLVSDRGTPDRADCRIRHRYRARSDAPHVIRRRARFRPAGRQPSPRDR